MNASQFFPESYAAGRERFRALARAAGGALTALAHPGRGPDGSDLSVDAAWFGPGSKATAARAASPAGSPAAGRNACPREWAHW